MKQQKIYNMNKIYQVVINLIKMEKMKYNKKILFKKISTVKNIR